MFSLFKVKSERHATWSDRRLFKALNAGDNQAFQVIVQRFHFIMYESAWHVLHSKEGAEDIVQWVLTKIWQEPARFAPSKVANVKAWLKQLCKNAAIDELRKRRSSDADAIESLVSSHSLPELSMVTEQRSKQLKQSIEQLPATLEEVVELYYFQDYSQKHIAKQLGVSLRSVEKRLADAKVQMRNVLLQGVRE